MYVIANSTKAQSSIVGQKAWNLSRLKKYFCVPDFVVISTQAFDKYRQGRTIDEKAKDELVTALEYLLKQGLVAVRSSATSEDLAGLSFAGMYTTTLNIRTVEDGIAAIIRTWNSIDSERVMSYCRKMAAAPGKMAVIMQHQLEPEVSGVMVTQSPFSVREILIECCQGLGDKLVSGKITPTRYRIRENEIIHHDGAMLLSKNQISELTRIGKKIEKFSKSPQDIEWAIEKEKIYVLQSRPIAVSAALPRRFCQVWSNVNVRETMPEPISPLWWSFLDDMIYSIFIKSVFNFPMNRAQYEKYRVIEMLSGRVYWNVNSMIAYGRTIGPILDLLEGSRSLDPQLAAAFRAVDLNNLPQPMPRYKMFFFTIIAFPRLIYYMLLSFFRYQWMFKKLSDFYNRFEKMNEEFAPADDLNQGMINVRHWLKSVMWFFARRYFGGVFLSIMYVVLLSRLLRVRMNKQGEATARKAMLGIIDKTGEMVLALNNLARLAQHRIGKITVKNFQRLYKKDKVFRKSFDQFIADFGHRGPAEFDIASPNWREKPRLVYGLIQNARHDQLFSFNRTKMIKELLASMRPTERFILKVFLPRIEALMPLRENGKHLYLKAAAKLKDQLFIIADILAAQGFLAQRRDIFSLSIRDLEKIREHKLTARGVLQLVKTRKKQWQEYQKTPAPDIIYSTGERIFEPAQFSKVLVGESLSYGKVRARARIIKNFAESHKLKNGEILVTHHTDPGWTPLFNTASGVIIEVGGVISHAAMVARELGIPAIVVKGATKIISPGSMIELDADNAMVNIL